MDYKILIAFSLLTAFNYKIIAQEALSYNGNSANISDFSKHVVPKEDTLEVRVGKIVFLTKDSSYNCFMTINSFGMFHVFASQERLDNHIEFQTSVGHILTDHEIVGTVNYITVFKELGVVDSIYTYRSSSRDYSSKEGLKIDNIGRPILEYDIEHSYIIQQMNQKITEPFIYAVIISGTRRLLFWRPGYTKSSILIKTDLSQDSTFNFFTYEAESKSYSGMQMVKSDSAIIPMKKMKKLIDRVDRLKKIDKSNVYSNNAEKTHLVIVGDKRYVVSSDVNVYPVEFWVDRTEDVAFRSKKLRRKFLRK